MITTRRLEILNKLEATIERAKKENRLDLLSELNSKLKEALNFSQGDERLWSMEEASAFLQIKPSTIRKKCCLKQIPYIDIGAIRFKESDLRRWVESRQVQPHKTWS